MEIVTFGKWPFHDESSGAYIYPKKFYGFYDAGGVACTLEGYDDRDEAMVAIKKDHPYDDDEYSIEPEDLGDATICILSGEEFITQLCVIAVSGGLSEWGTWDE